MNIALLGYGKMGQLIEKIALENGHTISSIANSQNPVELLNFTDVDVAIDFSTPDSAFKNISTVLNKNIPVVSGTTAWLDRIDEVHKITKEKNTAFLYASNFSIGVNLFFELNKKLNQLMNIHTDYKVSIKEIHHTEKLDMPSGTALTLQSSISESTTIQSERIKDVPGTHIVNYASEIDTISISHETHNRNGFAQGALLAAKWIINKKGCFSMKDILEIN
jgi:4-hydroxy-tetrahydrodipicolinate reductase